MKADEGEKRDHLAGLLVASTKTAESASIHCLWLESYLLATLPDTQ